MLENPGKRCWAQIYNIKGENANNAYLCGMDAEDMKYEYVL